MTAHAIKPTITPARIQWFAEYYKQHPEWGVFHVSLADGNWRLGAAIWGPADGDRRRWPQDLQDVARWFDQLTPSQRRRLRTKAEELANTIKL